MTLGYAKLFANIWDQDAVFDPLFKIGDGLLNDWVRLTSRGLRAWPLRKLAFTPVMMQHLRGHFCCKIMIMGLFDTVQHQINPGHTTSTGHDVLVDGEQLFCWFNLRKGLGKAGK